MRISVIFVPVYLFLPVNVFAHAGHVEWGLLDLSAWTELVEASVVFSAIVIYLLVSRKRHLKSSRVKIKRHH